MSDTTDPASLLAEREEREKFAFLQLTEPEKVRFQVRAYANYKKDPWEFLRDCVWTLNQVNRDHPVAKYPSYFPYLPFFVRAWQRHNLIAVPKSRRMLASWTCIPLYLWDTIFHPGRFNGFVSKKEDDAGDLVSRAEFIFRHIPEWRIPRELLPKIGGKGTMTKSPPVLEFPDLASKIQGFPMGADQLRQFTLSGIFGDECAFWEQAEDFYAATKPTLDGGGRMTLVSSRSPGFFKKLVFDRLQHPDLNFPERPPVPSQSPLTGVEVWKNPENRFLIIDLHYTANPEKRGRDWLAAVKNSMPIRKFMQEYEKTWQTFEGLPVYGDYSKPYHVAEELEAELGLPLLIAFDFGLTPAAVLAQLVGKQLRILREWVATNEALNTFAPKVWSDLRLHYTQWTQKSDMIITFIDPAGFQRAQTDARTCAGLLRSSGFEKVTPGPIDFESRKNAVETFLTRHTKQGAGLLIDERYCPTLIEGFSGGYQYPTNASENEPARLRPLKNNFSHPHDALQYLAAGAIHSARRTEIEIPTPSYGFQRREETKE